MGEKRGEDGLREGATQVGAHAQGLGGKKGESWRCMVDVTYRCRFQALDRSIHGLNKSFHAFFIAERKAQ